MKIGSLVECITDFSSLKKQWPQFNFPSKNDILVVSQINKHLAFGFNLISFEEFYHPTGIHEKHFRELDIPEINLEDLLQQAA